MHIVCVFPSGRVIDRILFGEERIRDFAQDFPAIIYMLC